MPGIVGLITRMPRERAERELLLMVEAMRHESSYEIGTWVDEEQGIYVGWAARKGSFADGMPLRNEKDDMVLVFSGEEYSDPGAVRNLRAKGHVFKEAQASYLVHLCEEDRSFPAALNGRFHGLLTDRTRKTAMLFNDRYGMQRIYYHQSNEAFYFAGEAKAILAARPALRKADPRGIGELISCGCVLDDRTIFEGIHLLPPASAWTFRAGVIEERGKYFQQREWEEQAPLSRDAYYQELREVFSRNIPRYFQGSEKIGMSLTGGLDTRVIMAWHKSPAGSLPCYSFGGMFRDCQDVQLARQIARVCGQPYQVIEVGKDFLSRFAHYAERTVYLTDGCASVRCASDLYANEHAARIAPIRMTGNYGGEVLRRLRAFKPGMPRPGLFRPEFLSHVEAARETYASALQTHPISFSVFRQAPWHHHSLLALEQTQVSLRSPYVDNDLVRTAFRSPDAASIQTDIFEDNNDDRVRLIGDGDSVLRRIRTDRGLAGDLGNLSSRLYRNWLEFAFKAEYAYDYGMPQWVAKIDHRVSWFHLERLFLGRHKFNHFRVWYRDTLSGYVREVLLDRRTLSRPYLDPKTVETIVNKHITGVGNYTTDIHTLLTLELVQRQFFDPQ